MKSFFLWRSPLILWSVVWVFIISAYWYALAGPLVFDDQLNIVENPGVAIPDLSFASLKRAALSNESGRLKRILPALSFGINYYYAGGFADTFAFKATNLVIHLLNSSLVFWLVSLLWPRCKTVYWKSSLQISAHDDLSWLPAAFAALLWALHPLQATAVVYVVQRMTSLSAAFVLLGLAVFVMGRERFAAQRRHGLTLMSAGIVCGTIFGLLCKENAALLPLYASVIEFTLFSRDALTAGQRRKLQVFYWLVLGVPVCAGLIYMFVYPGGILQGYASRPFTLAERLLTQARVLWFYLSLLFMPDITALGLFHDDVAISSGWLTPWTTLPAVAAWVLVLSLAVLLRHKSPVIAFAVLWYLVGHSMESSFIPLEMVFEHRNYLPSLGPILLFCALGEVGMDWLENKYLLWRWRNAVELDGAKPSQEGESWVRGNQIREKKRFISPHSNLLPEAEGSNSTVLCCYGRQTAWIRYGAAIVVAFCLYTVTLTQADYWRSEDGFIASQAINHPFSPSTQYLYGEVLYKKQRDPLAAYPYYYRAAQLKPREVGFLISLHMVTPTTAIADVQKAQYHELLDPRYIERLLRSEPVSAWGMRALDVAAGCTVSKFPPCMEHLDDVRAWLRAFVANSQSDINTQRHFINVLFDAEMAYALYDDALRTIASAKLKDPEFPRYYFMHADVLAAKQRYAEALLVLNEMQQKWADDSALTGRLSQLRQGIEALAEKAKHAPIR